jgi:branched-chain amino acid transport system ATP-binding protein
MAQVAKIPAMTGLLAVDNISLRFGGVRAVQGLSFTVQEKEILGLIGPNGAGKSTVFNLIDGIYPPDEGRVVFSGKDITGEKPYRIVRHGIARTHQIVQPLTGMSVLENCMVGACFGFENQNLRRARETAAEVLELVGLADRAEHPASQLTIAGKKRLELARALCARPMLLLLDEVLAGLNPSEVERMIGIIRGIRERGVAILIIEHLMQAIMSLSDRIVVLNTGQKLAEGLPAEIVHDKKVIEAYLGDPNIVAKLGGAQPGGVAS